MLQKCIFEVIIVYIYILLRRVLDMNVAYVRVSTVEQNEERQIAALEKYNIDMAFEFGQE